MDIYYLRARLFPRMLTIVPLIALYICYIAPEWNSLLQSIWSMMPVITGISLSVATIFLLVQVNRYVSKVVFQNLFYKDEIYMPTTEFLMPLDEQDGAMVQRRIYNKIFQRYGINVSSDLEELCTELKKRKYIVTIVARIRKDLRGNKMLLQHNIEYGFFRNLAGGSLVALLSSIIFLVMGYLNNSYVTLGWTFVSIYILSIVMSCFIMCSYGKNYAKVLFEEFEAL